MKVDLQKIQETIKVSKSTRWVKYHAGGEYASAQVDISVGINTYVFRKFRNAWWLQFVNVYGQTQFVDGESRHDRGVKVEKLTWLHNFIRAVEIGSERRGR